MTNVKRKMENKNRLPNYRSLGILINKRAVILIFLATLATRLAIGWQCLLSPTLAMATDSWTYARLAEELIQGRFPGLFRTPGYPLFLALTGGLPKSSLIATLLVQILLDCVTALLLAAVALRLLPKASSPALAGLLWAVCPVAAVLSATILSETLFGFLVAAALYVALYHRGVGSVLAQGLCWGAAILTRPSGLLLPFIVSLFLAIKYRTDLIQQLKQGAALVIYLSLVFGWMGINYQRAGMAVLSTVPDTFVYIFELPAVKMVDRLSWSDYFRLFMFNPRKAEQIQLSYEGAFVRDALARSTSVPPSWIAFRERHAAGRQDNDDDPIAAQLWSTVDDPRTVRWLKEEADGQLKGRLLTQIGIHAIGTLQTLRPISPWALSGPVGTLLDFLRVFLLPVAAFVLVRARQWWLLAFLTVWIGYALVLPGSVGGWRLRSLAEPAITLALTAILSPVLMHWHLWKRLANWAGGPMNTFTPSIVPVDSN